MSQTVQPRIFVSQVGQEEPEGKYPVLQRRQEYTEADSVQDVHCGSMLEQVMHRLVVRFK